MESTVLRKPCYEFNVQEEDDLKAIDTWRGFWLESVRRAWEHGWKWAGNASLLASILIPAFSYIWGSGWSANIRDWAMNSSNWQISLVVLACFGLAYAAWAPYALYRELRQKMQNKLTEHDQLERRKAEIGEIQKIVDRLAAGMFLGEQLLSKYDIPTEVLFPSPEDINAWINNTVKPVVDALGPAYVARIESARCTNLFGTLLSGEHASTSTWVRARVDTIGKFIEEFQEEIRNRRLSLEK